MKKITPKNNEPRSFVKRGRIWILAGACMGLLLLKCSWNMWSLPYYLLQQGISKGRTEFPITELIGIHWKKVCIVPVGGYMWDSDFKTPGNTVDDFFSEQFGDSLPDGLNAEGSFVNLYIEHEWFGKIWRFIGERRHPYIKDADQRAKPPYWDVLVNETGIHVACTKNKNALITVKGRFFFTKDFEYQYRFVHDVNTHGQRLIVEKQG